MYAFPIFICWVPVAPSAALHAGSVPVAAAVASGVEDLNYLEERCHEGACDGCHMGLRARRCGVDNAAVFCRTAS